MSAKASCNCKVCVCSRQADGRHCFESCPPGGGVCIFCDISTVEECQYVSSITPEIGEAKSEQMKVTPRCKETVTMGKKKKKRNKKLPILSMNDM